MKIINIHDLISKFTSYMDNHNLQVTDSKVLQLDAGTLFKKDLEIVSTITNKTMYEKKGVILDII